MQKHDDVVQNLNGTVMPGVVIQVMLAFTNTPATIYSDAAGQVPIDVLKTDNLGMFAFYVPNGRYDIYVNINGARVAHETDCLIYDPEDDTRLTTPTSGSGGAGGSGGSGGGSGNGMTSEVVLPVVNAVATPDYALGNNFYVALTGNVMFSNPVNYPSGVDIVITVEQDAVGSHATSFGNNYALPDSQPVNPALAPNAISKINLHQTQGGRWLTDMTPPASFTFGYGTVTPLARIGSTLYYQMGLPLGTTLPGAMFDLLDGQTLEVIRNGRGVEVTGTIPTTNADSTSKVFRVVGRSVGIGPDFRPLLQALPTTRLSYQKAILNFEGKGHVYVRDLRIAGARNADSDARGLCPNADAMTMTVNNVEITDCNNGILTGNDNDNSGPRSMFCDVYLYDMLFDRCGIGGPSTDPTHGYSSSGFTHSVYFGHNKASVVMERCTLQNAVEGNNLKCRSANLNIKQVICQGAVSGRELEFPNGGTLYAEDCIFWKGNTSGGTGSLVLVGGNGMDPDTVEGTDTTRPRSYTFKNCRFQNDIASAGRDAQFVCNLDHDVAVTFIDCEFIGDVALANNVTSSEPTYAGTTTVKGIRYFPGVPPVFTLTGGPIGPRVPVGYFPIPMTTTD